MRDLPTGTVTFLFTDLESSTRLWEDYPDAMRDALARHDAILRDAVESHDGHVVMMTGDGCHAVFAAAEAALGAAADGQRRLGAEPWGPTGPLRVRMGIHTGAAELRDGDYFGPALNRAARLMAAAHGGQVVISQATELLARDHLEPSLTLADLGEHRLRDLSRPERVFQLNGPDLERRFAPLGSVDSLQGNLPTQVTSFVGRDDAVKAVHELVGQHRLVTVTGVGGVGKTRLATQVAGDLASEFPDGTWICELAAAADAEGLAEVAAAALDVPQRPGMSRQQSTISFLSSKHLFLVLDNCEHLLDRVAEFVELLLIECPSVRLLATSREVLSVDGEHVYGLRSMAHADAVRLFLDRAEAVSGGLALDETARRAVDEICERLDGIPLAIELAAARVLSMHPAEIAGLLDERFRLLSGGRRGGVERHQTLRATVEWSYSLLDDAERLVFDRLSVFAGSFDTDAAIAIVGDGVDAWEVREAVGGLVRKSMLTADAGDGASSRYAMLETLRQYGREQLGARDEIESTRRRHARYFAEVARRFGPALITDQELPATRAALRELDNLRAAVTWALDAPAPDDVAPGIWIVAALGVFVTTVRSAGIGGWAERASSRLDGVPLDLRVAVLGTAAFGALNRGDPAAAIAYAEAALADGVPATCPQPALAYGSLAITVALSDFGRAIALLRDGAVELEAMGQTWGAINLRLVAVIFAAIADEGDGAKREIDDLLPRVRALGNPANLVIALYAYASAWWRDDPDGAAAALEESLNLTEQGASDVVYADAQELIAKIRHALGDTRSGLEAVLAGQAQADRVGNRPTAIGILWVATSLLAGSGAYDAVAIASGITEHGSLSSIMNNMVGQWAAEHEGAVEAAKAALGPSRYHELVEQGAAMPYERVIEWTREAITAALDRTAG